MDMILDRRMNSILTCMYVLMYIHVLFCDPTKAKEETERANEYEAAIEIPEYSKNDLKTLNKPTDKPKDETIKDAEFDKKMRTVPCPTGCRCYEEEKSISFTTNCSNSGLTAIPVNISELTTQLLLDNNGISVLANYSFTCFHKLLFLDISDNQLHSVSALSFEGLSNLEYLSMAGNYLYGADAFPVEVFRPLLNLETLHIERNCNYQITRGCSYHSEVFKSVSNVKSLFMDGIIKQKPGPGFSHLKNLEVLRMVGLSLPFCWIGHLSLSWIEHFSQCPLKHISMLGCHIERIEPMVLSSFKKLESLDLTDNDRLCNDSSILRNLFTGLNNTNIRSLNLSRTCNHNNRLSSDMFIPLSNTKLETFVMEHSFIEKVDPKVADVLPQSLRYLSMSDNFVSSTEFLEK